jgi:hypothetical protein
MEQEQTKWQYSITPEDVYKRFDWREKISGYEVIDFRPPTNPGELFLYIDVDARIDKVVEGMSFNTPRLILRKKEPRTLTFVECSKEEATHFKHKLGGTVYELGLITSFGEKMERDYIPFKLIEK